MDRAWELQSGLCRAFEEYFGSGDPVFDSPREAEESVNAFLEWYSFERDVPGRGKPPAELYLDEHDRLPDLPRFRFPRELVEAGEQGLDLDVGVVFDEVWGIYILPHYGEVKEVFTGDYRDVPDHEGLLRALVKEEDYIPSFIIKRLIEENPDRAIEAFSSVYKNVTRLEELYQLFKEKREDWEEAPQPSVTPIRL